MIQIQYTHCVYVYIYDLYSLIMSLNDLCIVSSSLPHLPIPPIHHPPHHHIVSPYEYKEDESHSISIEKRWAIIALWKDNRTRLKISRKLYIDRRSVSKWINTYINTGTVDHRPRSGRPRITSEEDDINIIYEAKVVKFTSPHQIKKSLELDASRMTIDRRLQQVGLYGRVARHKRNYSEAEIQKRLAFANKHKDWTNEQWSKVLFSDEKCFYGKGFCGRTWVRREIGEALNPDYCVDKVAHPIKLNVWGCFCSQGVGYSYIFNDNLDASLMKDILKQNILPSAELYFSSDPPEQWYLLHDNDKKFKSNLVTTHLHNNGITTINFPPYSPDLNPIENLWSILSREVEKKECDTINKLQDVISDEWNNIDKEKDLLNNLVCSMPKRCRDVIEAEGYHTKY